MTYNHLYEPQLDAEFVHLRACFREHGTALARTANKLGGRAASARVFLLHEAVNHMRRRTRTQRRQLINLHQLLTLQRVGDPDRIQTARFSEIDLASGFIEECCLLADKLEELLRQISGNDFIDPNGNATDIGVFSWVA